MLYLLDFHSKPQLLEEFVCLARGASKCFCAYYLARRAITDAKYKKASTFVRDGYAITTHLAKVELRLGFFELKPRMF